MCKRAAARPGERARCSRAMRGPCTPRKGKVRHPRHDCGAMQPSGSRSGAEAGVKRAARGRLSGRGAVGRCAGLVPNEKVKSVIRDTIAARRCQAARSQAWIGGKRAAQSSGSQSGVGAGQVSGARAGERAWCSRAMHGSVLGDAVRRCAGLVPHEKVKSVIHDTIVGRRCQAVRGQAWEWGQASDARTAEQAWCSRAMHGPVRGDAVRR